MKQGLKLLPGVVLAFSIMLLAFPAAEHLGKWVLTLQGIDPAGKSGPVSGVLIAILTGLLIRNLIGLPEPFKTGIQFTVNRLLRLGIILIGIKLSVLDLIKVSMWELPIVIIVIASGLLFIRWFTSALNLPERLGTLIAAGTGICGLSAILATAPAIDADEKEVAYAVANISIFGFLAMLFYPYLAHNLLGTSAQIGLFLGTAVHDTSQVVGAAMTYQEVFHDDKVLQAATVTKLTRNMFLAVVVPLLASYYLEKPGRGKRTEGRSVNIVNIRKLFPLFVLGFIGMALLRSIGDATLESGLAFGIWNNDSWHSITTRIGDLWGSRYLLGTAIAAVGLSTNFAAFRGIGLKPFAVGLAGALLVGLIAFLLISFLGQFAGL